MANLLQNRFIFQSIRRFQIVLVSLLNTFEAYADEINSKVAEIALHFNSLHESMIRTQQIAMLQVLTSNGQRRGASLRTVL